MTVTKLRQNSSLRIQSMRKTIFFSFSIFVSSDLDLMKMEEQTDKHIDNYAFLLLVEVNRAIYTIHNALGIILLSGCCKN